MITWIHQIYKIDASNVYIYTNTKKTTTIKHFIRMQNDTRRETLILNGQFKIITELEEFRMSLWVTGFGLQDARTGEVIIPVVHIFNLDRYVADGSTLHVVFQIYPHGAKTYEVAIHPFRKTFAYEDKTYSTKDFFKTFTGKDSN